jgi:hypothetical protein
MALLNEACPIWGTTAQVDSGQGDYKDVNSPRCGGQYRILGSALVELKHHPELRSKLTTWLVDQRRMGVGVPVISTEIIVRLKSTKFLNYSTRCHRFFEWMDTKRITPGTTIDLNTRWTADSFALIESLTAWIEAEDIKEAAGFAGVLAESGHLKRIIEETFAVTSKGYEAIEATQSGGAANDQGFVAMWFDPSLRSAYDDGFARGISRAGFRAFRIDGKETVGKIDDEIVAEIRRSRFVVADFTAGSVNTPQGVAHVPRGGVYFEAGFALGLGVPVIWTARKDCISEVHFDTRQFAHIVWSDPADLAEKLEMRIRAVIGEGPLGS